MKDLQIRLLFLILSLFISVFWTLTNPNKFKNLLQGLRLDQSKTGIVFIVYWVIVQSVLPFEWVWPSTSWDHTMTILGIVIALIGVGLACWAKIIMKSSWGRPAQHDPKKQIKLVTTGPFSFSRNPIYVGLVLFLFGFEIATRSYFILTTVPAFWSVYRAILIEEKLLTKIFGKEYETYISRVPRFL